MLCVIYKSSKKAETYLFVKQRDDFSDVPKELKSLFGQPILVTVLNLASRDKLAMSDINKVKEGLINNGFFLQLPPPQEDLLKTHKAQQDLIKKQQNEK